MSLLILEMPRTPEAALGVCIGLVLGALGAALLYWLEGRR